MKIIVYVQLTVQMPGFRRRSGETIRIVILGIR